MKTKRIDPNKNLRYTPRELHVQRTSHRVIERKLLECLGDDDKVAVILTERDLDRLISALDMPDRSIDDYNLRDGLMQLKRDAFVEHRTSGNTGQNNQ